MLNHNLKRILWTVVVLFFAVCNTANAAQISKEYQIKTAILIKLVQFFSWEDSSFENDASDINFCLLQPDPFNSFIDGVVDMRNIKTKGRTLSIKRVRDNELGSCHILFLSKQSEKVTQAYPDNMLLITEDTVLANSDFHLNLFVEKSKVRFEINVDNIRNSKININSQLLKVAKVVRND